uniref:Expansin-like EG45 domain-containing protein n=1 Tax=Quercus lobata TaxID=97700 RepID=A0A7N2L900_QUELO
MQSTIIHRLPYVPWFASACNGFKNDGVMIAAASNELWGNGAACGNNYKVKCLSGTNAGVPHPCKDNTDVVVTIVDFCSPGCQGTLDLSQEAFAKIADRNEGKINIDFQQV